MKCWRLRLVLVSALAVAMVLVMTGTALAGSVWYVNGDAAGANNGISWTDSFTDLQSALAAAATGDQIWVAAGTYKPTSGTDRSASFVLKSGVDLYGGFVGIETSLEDRDWSANPTILSGEIGAESQKSDHVVLANGVTDAALDGFTVTGGDADNRGGGMYNVGGSPTLRNVTFTGNRGFGGGGMYNLDGSPTLLHVVFAANRCDTSGGGMYSNGGAPALRDVTFADNSSEGGGGMRVSGGSASLTNCVFRANTARVGAGLSISGSSSITNCLFSLNNSLDGAVTTSSGSLTFTNCVFHANANKGVANYDGDPIFTNCVFSEDRATAFSSYAGSPVVTNCIFWGSNQTAKKIVSQEGTPLVTYSIVQGGYAGEGNLDMDPLFADVGNGDFHLQAGSPAIDAGTAAGAPALDLDGVTRPRDGNEDYTFAYDMGAYEFPAPLPNVTLATGWNLIGNLLGRIPATLILPEGHVAFVYDPQTGFYSTLELQPGQGAWVKAAQGGVLEFAPAVD